MSFPPLFNRSNALGYEQDAYTRDAVVQWWYTVGQLANGWRLSTFLLPRGLGTTDGHSRECPLLGITLRSPEGRMITERRFFDPSEFSARTDRLAVELGKDCRMVFDQERRRFLISASAGRLAYDLEIVPELEPWSPFPGKGKVPHLVQALLRKDLFTRDTFFYVPFVPRGRLAGRILIDGEPMDASGTAYHEKSSISYPIHELVPVWHWMHIEHEGWTILSGTGVPPTWISRRRIPGGLAYLAKGDRPLFSAFDPSGLLVRWTRLSHANPPKPGARPIAWDMEARFAKPGLQVRVSLSSVAVLESMFFEFAPPTPELPYWVQTVAEATVEVRQANRTESFSAGAVLETTVTGMQAPPPTK